MLLRYLVISLIIFFSFALHAEEKKAELSFDQRAVLAATHMGSIQRKTGFFSYEFNFVTGEWSRSDELVRQAGAGYGLGEYLTTHQDPIAKEALKKALKAYSASSVSFRQGKLLAFNGDLKTAETGATALAMAAALQYRKATGGREFDGDIEAWMRGLLELYHPGGGFANSAVDNEESPYFNGETWLAVAMYFESFPDAKLKSLLMDIDKAMINQYAKAPDIGFFHWGLMASAKRFEQTRDAKLIDFAAGQVTAFLGEMRPNFDTEVNSCYSVEGMASVLPELQRNGKYNALATRLLGRVRQEMTKNIAMQILPDQKVLQLVSGRSLIAPEIPRYAGAFINGLDRPDIRIDFTQHCLSALIKTRGYQ